MSTTRAVAHNTIIQIAGKAVSTALGLLAIGMMTRYLGAEQFGWYTTTISFLGFAAILIDFGLIPVTAQMMSEPRFEKQELFKNLLGFRFVTAVAFLGVAPLVALFFPYPYEVKIAIAFTTLSFLGVAMNQILIGFYQTKLAMHIQMVGELMGRIALLIALWVLILKGASFLWVMGAVTLSGVVYTTVLWALAARDMPVGFQFNREIWSAILAKMWPIAISIMCNVVYLRGDAVLLSTLRPQAEVGIYGAAYRVLDIVAQLAMMMMGIWLPLLASAWSRERREEFRARYQQSFDAMMFFALPSMTGILVLAEPIMTLVAGEGFALSGKILGILALAVFGVYLGAVFGHAAVAINRQKQTMWIYISDAVITLIGYLIFIPAYGIWGAAWMTVFSEWYAGVLLFFIVRRYAQESLRWVTVSKIATASLAMAAVLSFSAPLHVLIRVVLGALAYGIVLFAIGGISKQMLLEIVRTRQ